MTTPPYVDVWQQIRNLPVTLQIKLAEALLHNVRATLSGEPGMGSNSELQPLVGLSQAELRTLAETVVAPEKAQILRELLEKNREHTISREETETLDALLEDIDRVALLKARARYTLHE